MLITDSIMLMATSYKNQKYSCLIPSWSEPQVLKINSAHV